MRELKARLEKAGAWNDKLENELQALWKYGLERISYGYLRATVKKYLLTVPVRFFTDPASKSGNLHPYWQNGAHGTLRSIVESCVLVPLVAKYIPELVDHNLRPDPHAVDIALAATIVSDTWKKEDDSDVHHGPWHGHVAAEHWREFATAEKLEWNMVQEVALGSMWHYGVYTPGWMPGTPLSPVAHLVNLCDAITAQPALAIIYEGRAVIQ